MIHKKKEKYTAEKGIFSGIHLSKGLVILLFTFTPSIIQAQVTVSVTGSNASGSGGSVSYTVGQVFNTSNVGSNGSVAQGVQQPYEISVVTNIEEGNGISLSFMVYPNPTTDVLILKIEGKIQPPWIASLYDMNGKLLENKKIIDNETTISMGNYASAIYFLKIADNNKEIKTFKIIKK